MSKSLFKQGLAVVAGLVLLTSVQANDMSDDAITERLQPAGVACVEGEACAASAVTAASGHDHT